MIKGREKQSDLCIVYNMIFLLLVRTKLYIAETINDAYGMQLN